MNDSRHTWNLSSIYPSIDSPEYRRDKEDLLQRSSDLLDKLIPSLTPALSDNSQTPDPPAPPAPPANWLKTLEAFSGLFDLVGNLESYVYAVWSTNTADEPAQKEIDDLESRKLKLKDAAVQFRQVLAQCDERFFKDNQLPEAYQFWLNEQKFLASRQMSPAEESLAADLQRSGGDAWDRLHGKLSSSLSSPWDHQQKTLTELRGMAYSPDRSLRRRAWLAETALLEAAEVPLAAALNGVKGTSAVLNTRRGWPDTLEKSLFQNRLSRRGLDAMLTAMNESLPMFRRCLHGKARALGLDILSWYDLFAPLGAQTQTWSWEKTAEFIPRMFDTFALPMGNFARRAFDERWIDVYPRSGKVGGAYCTHFPLARQSRILCNFDGSFDSVFTAAHELGHAWHGEVMKDLPGISSGYPMTLAETASIFAETLVFRAALAQAAPADRLSILDTYLMGAGQVIVDILSRFHFESQLMEARPGGELSPRELSEMMLDAQQRTYGDALHPEERHRWMWAVKTHYYSPDLAFYNFPYAFGQLFALGLYARFREEGPDFSERFNELLRQTGSDTAAGLARSAGFDIEHPDFWRRGLASLGEVIDEFLTEVKNHPPKDAP